MKENQSSEQGKWVELMPIIIKNILSHWRFIVLISMAVAILADTYYTWQYTPLYQCQATFAIKTNANANGQSDGETSEIANAFGYIISSNLFKNRMSENIDADISNSYFSCNILPNTNIIQISAISPKAKTSYQIMDYLIDHHQDISQLVLGNVNIEVLQDKTVPTVPFNYLNHQKNLLFYGGSTMVFACVLVAVLSHLKDTIKTKEDIQEKLQMPVFATVPMENRHQGLKTKKSILLTQLTTSFQFVEEFKRMRVKIEGKAEKYGYKVILITSTKENEGKSSVVANLAIALAANDKKVLVVDGDLRNPSQYKVLQLRPQNALKYYLDGEFSFEQSIKHDEKTHVDCLLQKKSFPNVLDTLESPAMQQLFEEARQQYDYILVDTPPAGYFNDAIILSQYCDALLLVCKQDYASSEDIYDMISQVSMTQKDILGVVFNQKLKPLFTSKNSYHYYHYGYSYGYYGNYGKKKKE